MIRDQAKAVAKYLDIPEDKFKASAVWIKNFKSRHGVRKEIWTGGQKIGRVVTGAGRDHDGDAVTPLNPEFDTRSVVVDKEPYDSDLEFSVESGGPPDSHSMHQEQVSPSMSFELRPAWPSHASTSCGSGSISSTRSIPGQDTGGLKDNFFSEQYTAEHRHKPHSDTALHHNRISHTTVPRLGSSNTTLSKDSEQGTNRDSHRNTSYDTSLHSFPQLPLHSSNSRTTSSEAADAVDKLIGYIDAQPPGSTLSGSDRSALNRIRYALFQATNPQAYTQEN
jgi:hypothetical protein